ncbi:MAG: sulfatase-like hydrolase/transferase [Lachnospiraceae bacterium]|nr:sulfatase-like hydrolase/transferase [Lachnospiraceae bacterium]
MIKFSIPRVIGAVVIIALIIGLQFFMVGSLLSKQTVTTEAGNTNSAVIGILDDTEIVRQKFAFDRDVVLTSFALNFGSFKKDKVGDKLHIQFRDGNNDVIWEKSVSVNKINANSQYIANIDEGIKISKESICCIHITCSSKNSDYAIIPTLNTTNRTDPNTYMSTVSQQTHKKSLDISYTYTYGQVYPLILFIVEILLILFIMFSAPVKELREGDKRYRYIIRKVIGAAIFVLNPLVLFNILERMNGTASTIKPNVVFFTWVLLMGIQLIFTALINRYNIAMMVMDILLLTVGLVNLFVMNVRGTPFLPSDILGVKTAKEVADHYTLSLTPAQFVVFVAFIIWCMILMKFRNRFYKVTFKKYAINFVANVVPAIVIVSVLYNTSILPDHDIVDNVWNKVSSCKTNGFYMNYFINFHYLKVSSPSRYSKSKVETLVNETKEKHKEDIVESGNASLLVDKNQKGNSYESAKMVTNADFATNGVLDGEKPNIILIMNESFADFSLVNPSVSFNQDPLPFIHSMKKDTIKGVDYVSVFGAGTSNSEFEAMTGNTMKFFPSGSNVYQQFTHKSTFSLPSYLKELGYTCLAVHPSSGSNWNRVNAYTAMDFDEFITIDDFKNPEYIRYISDKESYKKVIEQFENKAKDEKLYVFDMTIQGHGGYLTNTDWDTPIKVSNAYFDQTDEFLSSTYVSDQAFEYLIDYFENQDEPTIICMFGDHFPSVETSFYEQILGKEEKEWDLDDIQKRFGTPYILWANYDIPEVSNCVISNNYLENMLLKQAGLELPAYNQYLEDVSREIPAMNVNGYMDISGKWHYYDGDDETNSVKEILDGYELLQYAYYSDTDKEKMSEIFGMNADRRDEVVVK